MVRDDKALLDGLEALWREAKKANPKHLTIFRVGITLIDITPEGERQMDLLLNDDKVRKKWEAATDAADKLNLRYGRTVLSQGPWNPPKGGHVGGKISYTRIPTAEDFW